ncbi:MAG TPA: hypothetical protein VF952_16135 [Chloroflexia bacterium]
MAAAEEEAAGGADLTMSEARRFPSRNILWVGAVGAVLILLYILILSAPELVRRAVFPTPDLNNPPQYPGARDMVADETVRPFSEKREEGEIYKTITFYTDDAPQTVLDFYQKALEEDGWPGGYDVLTNDTLEYSWDIVSDPRYDIPKNTNRPYRKIIVTVERVTVERDKQTRVTIEFRAYDN